MDEDPSRPMNSPAQRRVSKAAHNRMGSISADGVGGLDVGDGGQENLGQTFVVSRRYTRGGLEIG